ncbi:MAG: YidC/Oxa1 family membrane protein insertase [Clostridiales bacterium]|nr:YidC/Oxa1 family membrane protein insertase [Clostridiales bacterium]
MAHLKGLLSAVTEPTGFWIDIIKFFEKGVGQYILAIILLTLIIKVLWGFVDFIQKWTTQKQSVAQARMQPEMEALRKKYEKQPQVLQQKQNELQKKYLGKSMTGSCIVMLVVMILNLAIFFSLFSSLNLMASYKSAQNYERLKYTYINCINVYDQYLEEGNVLTEADYANLKFTILDEYSFSSDQNEEQTHTKYIAMFLGDPTETGSVQLKKIEYKTDFGGGTRQVKDKDGNIVFEEDGVTPKTETIPSNVNVIEGLLKKYFPVDAEGNYDESQDVIIKEEGEEKLYRSTALQNAIMPLVVDNYDGFKDSFLWIENIWVADSPFNKSIVSYNTLVSQIGSKNIEEGEETIYNAFMSDLKAKKDRVNGFFILPLLCILASFGTSELTTWYNRRRNKKKGLPPPQVAGKFARIFMPMLIGVFALLYNSVFAMYMLIGQIVTLALLLPQLILADKMVERSENKKKAQEKEKVITVDYSRKF